MSAEDIQGLKTFESKDLEHDLFSLSSDWGECVAVFWNEKYLDMNYPPQLNILNCRFEDATAAKFSFNEISSQDFNYNGSCKKIPSNLGEASLQLNCTISNTEVFENFLIVLDGNQRYTINITNGGPTAQDDVQKAYELFEAKGKGARMFEIKSLLPEPIEPVFEIVNVAKKADDEWLLIAKEISYGISKKYE
ncbi:MAG: hypothetical protein Q7K34_03365 [archaeon]|nr:hypothetical protein [archaeon]